MSDRAARSTPVPVAVPAPGSGPAGDDGSPGEGCVHRTILRGAARALRTHGRGVGMAEIARTAGVGRATLYRHFADREALFAELTQFAADECVRALRRADLSGAPVRDAVLAATRALLAVGREYWVIGLPGPASEPTRRELAVARPLSELAARGQREGVLRCDLPAERLGALHGALIQGALLYPQFIGEELDDAARSVTSLYVDGAARRRPDPQPAAMTSATSA
ncbi:TetR/AcrR family transcriptional regulator [Streptomyces eurythermus]|uniref:TetR/AcrR family transcriptional regulator n=1 Tax=Streptomyces eurythermus TaxID=42237 RepID=UPI0033C11594